MFRRLRIPSLGKRGQSGSVAMEFGLVAPIFFMILFATFEAGITYFANLTLTNGVSNVARLVRTGQAQTMTQSVFRGKLCDQVKFILSCDADKLYLDVRAYNSFGTSSFPTPLDANGNVKSGFNQYQIGQSSEANANDIVLVRAMYTWPLFTPGLSNYFSNMSGNKRLLSATAAFRNEPF